MNPFPPHTPQGDANPDPAAIEVRITALLLGEVPPDEAEALRARIQADPALRSLHDRLRIAIELTREASRPAGNRPTRDHEPEPRPRLDSARREQLLARFRGEPPAEAAGNVIPLPAPHTTHDAHETPAHPRSNPRSNPHSHPRPHAARPPHRRDWLAVAAMLVALLATGSGIHLLRRNESARSYAFIDGGSDAGSTGEKWWVSKWVDTWDATQPSSQPQAAPPPPPAAKPNQPPVPTGSSPEAYRWHFRQGVTNGRTLTAATPSSAPVSSPDSAALPSLADQPTLGTSFSTRPASDEFSLDLARNTPPANRGNVARTPLASNDGGRELPSIRQAGEKAKAATPMELPRSLVQQPAQPDVTSTPAAPPTPGTDFRGEDKSPPRTGDLVQQHRGFGGFPGRASGAGAQELRFQQLGVHEYFGVVPPDPVTPGGRTAVGDRKDAERFSKRLPAAGPDDALEDLESRMQVVERDQRKAEAAATADRPNLATAAVPSRDDFGRVLAETDGTKARGTTSADTALTGSTDKRGLVQLEALVALDARIDPPATPPIPPPAIPQPEVETASSPFSTFSLNVSDVSFQLAAASLEKGALPPPGSIRTEEFINAFDYRDPVPSSPAPVAFAFDRARDPFAHNRDMLRFSIRTAASGRDPTQPLNLVLLIDNSGSMERADRVRIRQACLQVLASQLQPHDRISIVTFARTARLAADGLPGNQAGGLADQVGSLTPEGGTHLEGALDLAYRTARRHFNPTGINRVVLLTDGAANLGDVSPDSLRRQVETHRRQGIALDCFGIGWEGLNDDLLENLSRNGDGRYGFINAPEDATTRFASQLAGALQVAASDVKVQVEFNPRRVLTHRQVGYARHQLTQEQFRDNTVDAAELAAAEAGNALYVVQVNPAGTGPIATVRVRFKSPGTADHREQAWDVPYEGSAPSMAQSPPAVRLAAAAANFAEWLAQSPHAAEVTPDRLLPLLVGLPESFPGDPRPARLESMIRQARSLTGR